MERNTRQNPTRGASNLRTKTTHEDLHNLLKRLQKIMDKLGYGSSRERARGRHARYQAALASTPSQKGTTKIQKSYEHYNVPVFNTYEEFHKIVLQSFENISIVLDIHGKVVFVSQNVSPLLGYCPEDIMGKSLLSLVLDEQKDEVSEKIILNFPLSDKVGSLIEFCCYIRKGNVGWSVRGRRRKRTTCQGRGTYDYVKFLLHLQDAYDESFVFFGNYGPNSRNIWSSAPRLLWEQQYYLVGNISVLRIPDKSVQPVKVQTKVIVIESDDDDTVHCRLAKRRRRDKMQRHAQGAIGSAEEHPESGTDVEIVDVQPVTGQMPFELNPVTTFSRSSTSTDISANTSVSIRVRSSTSPSSTDISSSSPVSSSGKGYVIDPKNMLEPQDMEFEVPPEFLLDDSEEEASPEQGDCTEEDVKKPLEETKVSNPKEHVIDEGSAILAISSDDESCIIIEDTGDKKDPEIKEVVTAQVQGHQKAPEAVPLCGITPFQAVRPEAVVEPMVSRDLWAHEAEQRENKADFLLPGQDHAGYSQAEEDTNPHP
ncbi:circadian clock protein PASD1 [Mastomys coucha]|uniref:circadian clock protein PASD1 n=1 Tax=Mastomys coucha TaxID=35658 RepID=UPI001261CD04|nr:circadian clock protein PASD1 [Mastomys coucha]